MSDDGVRFTGRSSEVSLAGALFAWNVDRPVTLHVPGLEGQCVACFGSRESLVAFHTAAGIPFTRIKQVCDEREFFESLAEAGVEVIYEPTITPERRTRFTLVVRS